MNQWLESIDNSDVKNNIFIHPDYQNTMNDESLEWAMNRLIKINYPSNSRFFYPIGYKKIPEGAYFAPLNSYDTIYDGGDTELLFYIDVNTKSTTFNQLFVLARNYMHLINVTSKEWCDAFIVDIGG
jgi:hypothetical protein